jgi:hypothetical protein
VPAYQQRRVLFALELHGNRGYERTVTRLTTQRMRTVTKLWSAREMSRELSRQYVMRLGLEL